MRRNQFVFILGTICVGLLCSCQAIENKGDVQMVQVRPKIEEDAELKWMMALLSFFKFLMCNQVAD